MKVVRFTVSLLCLAAAPLAAQQNLPPGGVFGGAAPKFIPGSIWQRMLERPENAPDALTLSVTKDTAWAAAQSVLEGFDLPVTFTDPEAGQMAAVRAKMYKRMGKKAISEFLRCGEGTAGPNADMYVVYVTAMAAVKPAPGGDHTIGVLLTGQAVDLPNGRSDVVDCASTGAFEAAFNKNLMKRLGVLGGAKK